MTHHRRPLAAGLAALVAAAGVAITVSATGLGSDRNRFGRVREGMTRPEVRAVMGRWPNLSHRRVCRVRSLDLDGPPERPPTLMTVKEDSEEWGGDGAAFLVYYDYDTERVASTSVLELATGPSFYSRLRARLGL